MKNTKWLRRALLGGAALSVMATGVQADELSALKAQLEALQSRVSQLESQPAPVLPEGTKLLTMRKGQGTYSMIAPMPARDRLQEHQGYTIAVTPTADMPAPVSEVTVSGEIRVRALYQDWEVGSDGDIDINANDTSESWENDSDAQDFDITTRGRLRIDGKTETAIGEVGGTIRIEASQNLNDPDEALCPGCSAEVGGNDTIDMNIIWGYWQMTPNFQLGGGYWDSASAIQAGWDWNGEPALVGLDAGPTNGSISQIRLTYNNGPITMAVSVEDNENRGNDGTSDHTGVDTLLNVDAVMPTVAGFITYDAGSFLVTAAGAWQADEDELWEDENGPTSFEDTDDNWVAGIGAIVKLSDMFRFEAAANVGEGFINAYGSSVCSGTGSGEDCENDLEYWSANALLVIGFTEGMRLELGGAYTDLDHEEDELGDDDFEDTIEKQWTVAASMFWDPVDQLTLGAGVGFTHKDSTDDDGEYDSINAGFGAWFRF